VLPIVSGAQERSVGFLVAGLSPRRIIDADYRSFLGLVAGHVATAVSNAHAGARGGKIGALPRQVVLIRSMFSVRVSIN
jgi:GAF domain-containing protein